MDQSLPLLPEGWEKPLTISHEEQTTHENVVVTEKENKLRSRERRGGLGGGLGKALSPRGAVGPGRAQTLLGGQRPHAHTRLPQVLLHGASLVRL